ncbi:GNAT family N-acetyltransferase [Myroides odoratimimus]|uniref:GNAT family N-acetyltransferase n=1 Tax=Myroides odoratimimus TaxID=76832 RepID=UPI001CE07560|nr:GNAT family N-acetyltransferase [Myroides odoratimimus]MCA4806629.1 GNAT family N-acetyltransferase [Myroides odoratimimus]MDM1066194.1 GNAT family N-acetyltransferase [Myroides odoratimimus]MDM1328094.1 GNAT family N-acetyltransferase [Myroides odoratimimus]MDM1468001.1 GNAT family N-acetyltransferase [Myroides odoratimimus]MDM1471306.1 GNAT family N-acetyltransferase [Myroides odoratimimus]
MTISYQNATVADCELLTETALASKRYWGYREEYMSMWTDDLTITDINFRKGELIKCFYADEYIGFFELEDKGPYLCIDHFWVLPVHINKGYGRVIMSHIKAIAKSRGYKYIEVYAEPNANIFYEKMGGVCVRQVLTSVPGRMMKVYHLPVIEENWIDLDTAGLVVVEEGKLLLAYSNNKKAWYLPGGKIDEGEGSRTALIREIEEELNLVLDVDRLTFLHHITAPAYGEKLNIMMQQDCYSYSLNGETIEATNEIGAVKYFSLEEYKKEEVQVPGVLMVFNILS